MGLLSGIFNFISSIDGVSYIHNAKEWGDTVWNDTRKSERASLSLYEVDNRLYKRLRVVYRNDVVGIFTDSEDSGWVLYDNSLSKTQKRQLKEQGFIVIKRYKG